jgi:hypothetical protein
MVHDLGEDLIVPNNLNMLPPEEAQIVLGRVETFFFSAPEEHNLHARFSKQGMDLWEKFFAPNLLSNHPKGKSKVLQIPVSWFNFVTLMLMTPEKFDWAKEFLYSQLWEIIQEPISAEPTVSFCIPDKCAVSQAPSCLLLDCTAQFSPPEDTGLGIMVSPKRKRRESKIPLVESEVRRSPRLVLLNEGFKNHASCNSRNCLTCNASPPMINSKVVKNLASSFCKVDEKEVDRKLMKKSKIATRINKAPGPSASIQGGNANKDNMKKGKEIARKTEVSDKDKKDGAAGGAAQGAKKGQANSCSLCITNKELLVFGVLEP